MPIANGFVRLVSKTACGGRHECVSSTHSTVQRIRDLGSVDCSLGLSSNRACGGYCALEDIHLAEETIPVRRFGRRMPATAGSDRR